MNSVQYDPIGWVESCFKERFATPRQSGLVPSGEAKVWMLPSFELGFDGLEEYSHLWILTHFHSLPHESRKLRVRPPRLGGNEKLGVFATRSPYRPNPIGLSLVEFHGFTSSSEGNIGLEIKGGDFLHGTPVLDIKPHLNYADVRESKNPKWVQKPLAKSVSVDLDLTSLSSSARRDLEVALETLRGGLRPSYREGRSRHATFFGDHEVHWDETEEECQIRHMVPQSSPAAHLTPKSHEGF